MALITEKKAELVKIDFNLPFDVLLEEYATVALIIEDNKIHLDGVSKDAQIFIAEVKMNIVGIKHMYSNNKSHIKTYLLAMKPEVFNILKRRYNAIKK